VTSPGRGQNDNASNLIGSTGDILDNDSNIVLDYDLRRALVSSIRIGVSGTDTVMTAFRVYSITFGSGAIGANQVTQSTYTVSGLTTDDKVMVFPPNSGIGSGTGNTQLGIGYAFVSAADTLAIGWVNATNGSISRTSGTYTIMAFRS